MLMSRVTESKIVISLICLFRILGNQIVEKENLQDISLQSLQWLESRGLFGGGGVLHTNNKGTNINNNSGSSADIVTSANASGDPQFLGM